MMTAAKVDGAVLVNGRWFRVTRVGRVTVSLEAARGGWAALVKNAKSGAWHLVTERGSVRVESFEVAS
jgi:hypothetical protein